MKKRYLSEGLYIMYIFFCLATQAQTPNSPEMPKLTPSSPEAAAMNRYGEYPVSLFTGIPDISIPLYEVKSGKFTVPITLSYHASGNKVNDFSTWVGLGWSINSGGRVTRKVVGKDDQTHTRNVRDASSLDPTIPADHEYLESVANQTDDYDTEPDVYIYNFPGKSGRFIFDNSYAPIMIPYSGVKVADYHNPNLLTDESGSIYTFGMIENPTTDYGTKIGGDPISSWDLTKMVDAGRTDSIQFSYQSAGYGILGRDYVDYMTVDDQIDNTGCISYYNSNVSGFNEYTITTNGNEVVPSQITFSQGIMKFILSSSDREDRPDSSFKSIDRIEIYSSDDLITPMRVIKFYQSYFVNGSTKRLRLDSLRFIDKAGLKIQKYSFDYNRNLPLPDIDSKKKDYWGYFNNIPNDFLLPRMSVQFIGDNYSYTTQIIIGSSMQNGREPDPQAMQANILQKISYPTGGYTTFEYETNKYNDGQNDKYAGGLRIYKIKSYNENGICATKTYKYGMNETGLGIFNVFMNDFSYSTPAVIHQGRDCSNECTQYKRSRTFTSTPCTDINPYDGSPVIYSTVTEYIGDDTNNTGKIIYTYNDDLDQQYNCGQLSTGAKAWKGFRRGLLESKTVYKNVSGTPKKVSWLINSYFKYPTQYVNLGIKVAQIRQYDCVKLDQDVYEYACCNVPTYYGDNLLITSKEYQYDLNDETKYVVKTTNYDYNNSHYTQLSKITTSTSAGDSLINIYKYPTDDSTGYFPEMTSMNIIGVPIREYQVMNQTDSISSKRTNFNKYHNKYFAPSSIDFKTGTNSLEKRIIYSSYDQSGNLISVKKDKDIAISYTYNAYNQPIAEVANADTNAYYFNDFENADGNSSLDDSKTGRKSRTGGFSKAISGLQTGTYIKSWWSKSGGEWILNLVPVSINGSYTITLSGQVDDVRLYLSTATMKTYTYDPLIGITSMTDQNNISTYYEYDDFGRLKYIKDENKNILKAYDYHYKSEAFNP